MQTKNRINFNSDHNNKLACNAYAMLEISQPEKYQVGEVYEVFLRNAAGQWEQQDDVQIVAIQRVLHSNITAFMAYLDQGCSVGIVKKQLSRRYRGKVNPTLDFILLRRVNNGRPPMSEKEIHLATQGQPINTAAQQLVQQQLLFTPTN